jgi:hypothetical protein
MTVPGDVLAGRYRVVRRVAAGGMGSVWEAWDELLQRLVAIKELLPQPGLSKDAAAMARSRVIRQARITARLHHSNAVTLYDVIDHGGQPCLILQFVPSRTLNSVLAERGLLKVPFVTGVGAEVAAALAAAHQVGIIHRDVKPSNILITPAGAAMITDFGISHAAGDVSLTSTGMVTGTPAFLAPEVARSAPSGFPADVFSLGATLYAALEGTPPCGTDQNAMAMLHKVASGQIIPPRRSGELTSLLGQMLATDPAARPAMSTIARLLADLQARTSAVPRDAPPQTITVPPQPLPVPSGTAGAWATGRGPGNGAESAVVPDSAPAAVAPTGGSGRRPLVIALLAAAVLLLTGVGAWVLVGSGSSPQAAGGKNPVHVPARATTTSGSAQSLRTSPSTPLLPAPPVAPPTTVPPEITTAAARATTHPLATTSVAARQGASTGSATSLSPPPHTTSSTTRSATAQPAPTAAQLATAITDYYALLPGNTDQGWALLTRNFQTGTAQSRQYYQHFWDSIYRVTATDARGATPDTAAAKITYYFKDGRVAVEPTLYFLLPQGGTLKIDSSTVLSSTTP